MRLKLMTPGPVEVHPSVLEEMAAPIVSHRSREFREIYARATRLLERLAGASEALLVAGSGTTAVDAMAWSLVKPGEKVLVLSSGEFGERLYQTLKERSRETRIVRFNPRTGIILDEALRMVEEEKPGIIALVHNETSTGTAFRELSRLTQEARGHGARVIVDTVSGFPVEPLNLEETGIYAAATCSHKAIAAPPGVGIILLSNEAIRDLEKHGAPGVPASINLAKAHKFHAEKGETPFTPPVNTVRALKKALQLVTRDPEEYREQHKRKASLLLRLLEDKEFKPLPINPSITSNTVAAFLTPPNTTPGKLVEKARKAGYQIAKGMGTYKNKAIRIGVMGNTTQEDIKKLATSISS